MRAEVSAMTQHKKSEIQKIIELVDALPPDAQIELMEALVLKTKNQQSQYADWLRAEVQKGKDDIKAGNFLTSDELKQEMAKRHPELRKYL